MHKYKIFASYDFIFNNPYETIEDIKKTIDLILKFPKPFKLQGYNLIYYPGSAITDRAIKDGFINVDGQIDETSKIQAPDNSPLKSAGKTVLSSRFYVINYKVSQKNYYNLLIALTQFCPKIIIKLLLKNNNPISYSIACFLLILKKIFYRAKMFFRSLRFSN